MASAKGAPDFESLEYDTADVLAETAWILAAEAAQDRAAQEAEAQARQQAIVAYAVQACISSCVDALSALYVDREECPVSEVAREHNSWAQDPEPEPCSRDAWLRGSMPVVTVRPPPPPEPTPVPVEPPPAPSSRPSTRERTIRKAAAAAAAADAEKDAASTSAAASSSNARKTSTSKPAHPAKQVPPHLQEAEQRLRQELQIRRQQEALAQSLKQQDAEMRQQLATLQRDLKGKEYTYDQNGKVLLLSRPSPAALPAPAAPNVKVTDHKVPSNRRASSAASNGTPRSPRGHATANPAAASSSGAAAGGKGAGAASSKAAASKLGGHRSSTGGAAGAGGGAVRKDYVEAPSRAQPPALETLKPSLGVTLRVGASTKAGPKKDVAAPSSPTRAQFQLQVKAQRNTVGSAAPHLASSMGQQAGSRAGSANAGGAKQAQQQQQQQGGSSGDGPGGNKGRRGSISSTGGAAAAAASFFGRPGSGGAGGGGGGFAATTSTVNAALGGRWTVKPDIHLALTTASDWGNVTGGSYSPPPPLATVKPSVKQLKDEVGRLHHLPKERIPVAAPEPAAAAAGAAVEKKARSPDMTRT